VIDGLIKLLELLLRVLETRNTAIQSKERERLLVDLLVTYYVLRNVCEVGNRLLEVAGEDAVERATSLSGQARDEWMTNCHLLMRAQRNNLSRLGNILLYEGLPIVDVLDPDLRSELKTIIGNKEKGLFAIGAALEIYMIFGPLTEEDEEKTYGELTARFRQAARILELLLTPDREQFEIRSVISDLQRLKELSERFRNVVVQLCPSERLLEISAEAERRAASEKQIFPDRPMGRIIIADDTSFETS
jgi:hypothetical protein